MRPLSLTAACSPWYIPLVRQRVRLSELALFGMLGAGTFGMKVVMASLPNIEPVSLMVMLFAVTFGARALYPVYVYVALEYFLYGFNIWSVYYLYIWTVLAVAAWLLRRMEHRLGWALLSGCFGLLFGALCAPVDVLIGGFAYAAGRWVSGIPYDLLHCAGNFTIALLLFVPLRVRMRRLYQDMLNKRR